MSASRVDAHRRVLAQRAATPLSPQEKALAFMFFDIASCVGSIF